MSLSDLAASECSDRGRKTWRKCINDDMKLLGLQPEWALFKDIMDRLHIEVNV